jgi:hypothetical protein
VIPKITRNYYLITGKSNLKSYLAKAINRIILF